METGMTEQEVRTVVDEILEEYFEVESERLVPEAHVFDDLELDSLDIVDLIVALQKKFNVRIRDDERVRGIRTLGDIYQFVLTLQEEGVSPAA